MTHEKSCGVILVHDDKVLLVEQLSGSVGFPKGHMEDGETEVETAIRETKEETNLDVSIDFNKRFLISYIQKETILKEVVYFLATTQTPSDLQAQSKELKKAFWVEIDKVEETLTFDNLKGFWRDVLKEIK